jgi:HIRAN domain-containing protein
VTWEDDRIRVVAVAGVSFRVDEVRDASFDPGARLALVPEPENEHDPNAIAIWNEGRTLQAGYVPREVAGELDGSELAFSLWRAGEAGLRVLLVPVGSWVGRPRRER